MKFTCDEVTATHVLTFLTYKERGDVSRDVI